MNNKFGVFTIVIFSLLRALLAYDPTSGSFPEIHENWNQQAQIHKDGSLPAHAISSPNTHQTKHAISPTSKLSKRAKEGKYTLEEEALILDLRRQGLAWDEIADQLPGRNWKGIQSKHYRLNDESPDPEYDNDEEEANTFWTPEEDKRLVALRDGEGMTWKQVARRLPGRTSIAASKRYHRLINDFPESKTDRKHFTAEEDALLRKLAKTNLTWKQRSESFPGRTTKSLRSRYYRLTLSEPGEPKKWTTGQDMTLKALLRAGISRKNIARQMGKSYHSISWRINKLEDSGDI